MREADFRAWLDLRRWNGKPLEKKAKDNRYRRSLRAERALTALGFSEATLEEAFSAGQWNALIARLQALKSEDPDSPTVRLVVPEADDPTGQLTSMIAALKQYGYFLEGRDPNYGEAEEQDGSGIGDADKVRRYVLEAYVEPAREEGRRTIEVMGFSRAQADALLAAARAHPCGGREGTDILSDHHRHLTARQVVGVLAAPGASLEILPKVDPAAPAEDAPTVRSRLIHMIDAALGLNLSAGAGAAMARQQESLLDVLIRLFADRLLAEVRRGLPRRYVAREDDLAALRGSLDVVRQFTVHAVRPDRLACRFDSLESDTPLMRVMKACVLVLTRHARHPETQRRLTELRHVLADIPDVPRARLPWGEVRIDRTSVRWGSLFALAKLFLRGDWQATHHAATAPDGITLLFPMNVLFEAYVAARLRRTLAGSGIEVTAQGGLAYCLGDWAEHRDCEAGVFRTKPDILLRRGGKVLAVIDTKWKMLGGALDGKHGVGQGDVYQMMAYARLYRCERLTLLYPAVPGQGSTLRKQFGMAQGRERLTVATIDLADPAAATAWLGALAQGEVARPATEFVVTPSQ